MPFWNPIRSNYTLLHKTARLKTVIQLTYNSLKTKTLFLV